MERYGEIKKSDLGCPYQNLGIHVERYGDLIFEMAKKIMISWEEVEKI